ncbi:MAG: S8 family serine peptidase [bacterium]|nr:S8 family serine peptidase [bacterium]
MLNTPLNATFNVDALDASLLGATGPTQVIVRLKSPSVAEEDLSGAQAENRKDEIDKEQEDLVERIMEADDSVELIADVQVVLNAVIVEVDADSLEELAADPAVERVAPVGNYELDLSETVPYIGAAAAQAAGYDGSGITVAVLDSGIDYNHIALGGSGDVADYLANDPDVIEPGTFPTAKVVGGYDFVGSSWTGADGGPAEAPDSDPLDDGPGAGHGSSVGHIIAGVGGVAPAADLYAVKVCSSVSTSCSGVALIQGIDFALDPNRDGDPSDHVDIINMSLGSPYGQPFDDDLSAAVDHASEHGVLTVASAGNSADKEYITGSPAAAATALSVAQTQVPSAALQLISVNGADFPAVFQPWSTPLSGAITGPTQYGDLDGTNLDGCVPFTGDLTGLVVLVDRGACNFSLKIKNISDASGAVGIIGLVAPGAPFSGGDGGDRPINIPGYMISQADSNAIRAAIGADATVDETNQLPLIGQMVGSSSRGPSAEDNRIKPEIGAPGASVAAVAGSGTGEGPFGGTSGAAPMVAGSAALLLHAQPGLSPLELKAKLMNTGDTGIDTDPFTGLAPITRIGGGEVRVDQAISASAAAWDRDEPAGGLSFGFHDIHDKKTTIKKKVVVHNYSDETQTYNISSDFRYADDAANGAVSVSHRSSIKVKPGKEKTFTVTMRIRGDLLRGNYMNSGSEGANPAALTLNEYDGYITLDDGTQPIHLPWHVLPRQSAEVKGDKRAVFHHGNTVDTVRLRNRGYGVAQNDAYSLIATSDDKPEGERGGQSPMPDIRAVGVNTIPVPAGFCSGQDSFLWTFAINTWEPQTHLLPVSHQIGLDIDQDGIEDYVVLNRDLSFSSTTDGRQVTWSLNLATGAADAFFFAEHATNTGNTVLTICGEQVGLTGTDMLATNVDVSVFAQDFYFGGPGDLIEGLTITPLGERYVATDIADIAPRERGNVEVTDFGPFPGNTEELGLMLFTNGDRGAGARGGATFDTEAHLIYAHDGGTDHHDNEVGESSDPR